MFREFISDKKDGLADVTVFLVGKWKGKAGGDPAGTFFPDLDVIAVDDKPAIPMVPGNDPFTSSWPTSSSTTCSTFAATSCTSITCRTSMRC